MKAHIILGHVPQKTSCWNNTTPAYHSHIAHDSWTLYPLSAVHQSRHKKVEPSRRDKVLAPLAEPLIELLRNLLIANLVTRLQPRLSPNSLPWSHNPNADAHIIWIHLDTTPMTIDPWTQNLRFDWWWCIATEEYNQKPLHFSSSISTDALTFMNSTWWVDSRKERLEDVVMS